MVLWYERKIHLLKRYLFIKFATEFFIHDTKNKKNRIQTLVPDADNKRAGYYFFTPHLQQI